MTSREPRESLPLPGPRSPRALDERILASARARVAAGRPAGPPGWVLGLTAAGVVGVAVLLALPPTTPPETAGEAGGEPAARGRLVTDFMILPESARPPDAAPSPSAYFLRPAPEAAQVAEEVELPADLPAAKSLGREEIRRSIGACADLLAADRSEDAELCYRAFREVCADCGLPPTLAEALGRPPGKP